MAENQNDVGSGQEVPVQKEKDGSQSNNRPWSLDFISFSPTLMKGFENGLNMFKNTLDNLRNATQAPMKRDFSELKKDPLYKRCVELNQKTSEDIDDILHGMTEANTPKANTLEANTPEAKALLKELEKIDKCINTRMEHYHCVVERRMNLLNNNFKHS